MDNVHEISVIKEALDIVKTGTATIKSIITGEKFYKQMKNCPLTREKNHEEGLINHWSTAIILKPQDENTVQVINKNNKIRFWTP